MYAPPDSGCTAASRAVEVALQNATTAAMPSPTSRPVPAAAAAGDHTVKTPAPTIEPTPMTTA